MFEAIGSLVPTILPSKEAPINSQPGPAEIRITVGDFGMLMVKPLKGTTGEYTRHRAAAFRDNIILAKGTGSYWRDPDIRQWESGDQAEQADFDWSG